MTWTCERCGETMEENTTECTNCEYTVFKKPAPDEDGGGSLFSLGSSETTEIEANGWYCAKCGHVHDHKPFVCEECGGNAIRPIATSDIRSTESEGGLLSTLLLPFVSVYLLLQFFWSIAIRFWYVWAVVGVGILLWVFVL